MDGHSAASNQPSGSSTPTEKGTAHKAPVDSMESTIKYPAGPSCNGSGSQGATPSVRTPAAQAENRHSPGELKKKTPVYITGLSYTRSSLR